MASAATAIAAVICGATAVADYAAVAAASLRCNVPDHPRFPSWAHATIIAVGAAGAPFATATVALSALAAATTAAAANADLGNVGTYLTTACNSPSLSPGTRPGCC